MDLCCKHTMKKLHAASMATPVLLAILLCVHVSLTAAQAAENSRMPSQQYTMEIDALAEVLGIPIHEDVGPKRQKIPEFLQSIYDCWNSGSTDCLPEGISDANVVRSFLGAEYPSPPRAVQSYNHNTELLNSLTIAFNNTYKARQPETVKYALLRVHRRALSNEEIIGLSQKCDFSHLELRLYTTLGSNDKGEQIVVLKQTMDLNLTTEKLLQPEWYSFNNFTEMYRSDLEGSLPNKQHQLVMLRLSIAESDACPGITPSLLGFTSSSGTEAELIGFSKDELQASPFTSNLINNLSLMYKKRRRRQAEVQVGDGSGTVDTTTVKFDNISNVTTSRPEDQKTLEEIKNDRCQLYSHTISFADLGWSDYVHLPLFYEANFCAGTCAWPLTRNDNTTKHSYIQAVANLRNPDLIPPPCCVPKDLDPLRVSVQEADSVIVVKIWEGMIAKTCACR